MSSLLIQSPHMDDEIALNFYQKASDIYRDDSRNPLLSCPLSGPQKTGGQGSPLDQAAAQPGKTKEGWGVAGMCEKPGSICSKEMVVVVMGEWGTILSCAELEVGVARALTPLALGCCPPHH